MGRAMPSQGPLKSVLPTIEFFNTLDDYMRAAYLAVPQTASAITLGTELCYAISAAIEEHLTIQNMLANYSQTSDKHGSGKQFTNEPDDSISF